MFRSRISPELELDPIPQPERIFTGSLAMERIIPESSGLIGDLESRNPLFMGDVFAGMGEFQPGDDLSPDAMDFPNSVAEDTLLIAQYRPKESPSKIVAIVDIPERTLNTPSTETIFNLGRFCADACRYIAESTTAAHSTYMVFDESYQHLNGMRRPSTSPRLERVSKKRVVPQPSLDRPSVGNDKPLEAALNKAKNEMTASDVAVVFSDFNNADEATFSALSAVHRATNGMLWVVRPRLQSTDEVSYDGESNLTLRDYDRLRQEAVRIAAERDRALHEIASHRLREFALMGEPYRKLAKALVDR